MKGNVVTSVTCFCIITASFFTASLLCNDAVADVSFHWSKRAQTEAELQNGVRSALRAFSTDVEQLAQADGVQLRSNKKQGLPLGLIVDDVEGDIERFIEILVLNAEDVTIDGNNGEMRVNMVFSSQHLQFQFQEREAMRFGQIYAMNLDRSVSFRIFYRQGSLYASDLAGFAVLVKLPLIPDDVFLRQLVFEIERQMASLYATAVYNMVSLVARANVRLRRVEGIDWFLPFLGAIPQVLNRARFQVSPDN
jgi:hypothetical protein